MIRSHSPLLACLALSVACASQSKGTDNPDAGQYDGYYSDNGDGSGGTTAAGGDGETRTPTGPRPQARISTATRAGARKTGKAATLVAKKPPVESGEKELPKRDLKGEFAVDGVFPTSASVGSLVEIYGSGFPEDPGAVKVFVGGKRFDVVESAADRIVAEVGVAASGPVEVGLGTGRLNRRNRAKTNVSFVGTAADGAFGQPRTKVGHGLLGVVYEIDPGATEVPVVSEMTPTAYVAVDDLDITAGAATAGIAGLTQSYAIHFMGSLNVLEAGEYELCLNAGDGAILYLDQAEVLNADGAGEAREACELLYVEPGEYGVDLVYYQGADTDAALNLSWAKDGGERVSIPSEAFFPPEDLYGIAAGINQAG